jgi:uncharacterized RDD family membrane protein YckC
VSLARRERNTDFAVGMIVIGGRAAGRAAWLTTAPLRLAVRLSVGDRRAVAERGRVARVTATQRASEFADTVATRILESPEFDRIAGQVAEQVLESPEVRRALTVETKSFLDDLLDRLAARLALVDDRVTRFLRRRADPPSPFGGISLRALALGVDLGLVQVLILAAVALLTLVQSLAGGLPDWLLGTLVGVLYVIAAGAYLTFFWTVAGQTPGMNLLRLRVVDSAGETPGLGRSLLRLFGLWLAILPLCAGFLPVLFDARRRGVQDFVAGTTVERIVRG